MQVNGSVTNLAYKAPSEVDGQDRTQSRLQSQEQQTSNNSQSSGDSVDISTEAQALSARERTNDAALAVQEPASVDPGQTVQNVGQDQQNIPTPPVAPEQAPLETREVTTETANITEQQAQNQSPPTNPPAPTAENVAQNQQLQEATIVTQNVAPQNEPTPQKPASEDPLAAVVGLSAGKSIDLNV